MPSTQFLLIAGLLGVDQILKALVRSGTVGGGAYFLNIDAPFSVPWPGVEWVLYVAVVALIVVCVAARPWMVDTTILRVSSAAIIAGGLSNIIDRAVLGGVVDVLRIGTLHTNLADIYIMLGIIGFLYGVLAQRTSQPRNF